MIFSERLEAGKQDHRNLKKSDRFGRVDFLKYKDQIQRGYENGYPGLDGTATGSCLPSYPLRILGGPSGGRDRGNSDWWILIDPEVHFVYDTEVTVPDLSGWRRERIPYPPEGHRIEVVPDWVCEILSPSTARKDREVKMPLYAHYGMPHAWLIDPGEQTLEVYRLDAGT